jgi:tRNA modification GTPase
MFSTHDTIVAIATPVGRGAIGIVRLSGSEALSITLNLIDRTRPLTPRRATNARVIDREGGVADHVLVTWFKAPASYTGEDVVEISAHGSLVVLETIVRSAMSLGARLAAPGEFTLRAHLNGKLDLVQAEAIGDLIDAVTPAQVQAAFDQLEGTLTREIARIEQRLFELIARLEASLDFPDEGYHFVTSSHAAVEIETIANDIARILSNASQGRVIREGVQVAITGAPNVGKSSLFNALLNTHRAIVTEIPGTTRDLLTERVNLGGLAVSLIDTAGIRDTDDVVEREGVSLARGATRVADLTLVVLDRSRALADEDRAWLEATRSLRRIVVANKCDVPAAWQMVDGVDTLALVSAHTRAGLEDLVAGIALAVSDGRVLPRDVPLVSNIRHVALLQAAVTSLKGVREALGDGQAPPSEEFVLADLHEAAAALQEVTGRRTTDDLLAHIFQNFCIGK